MSRYDLVKETDYSWGNRKDQAAEREIDSGVC